MRRPLRWIGAGVLALGVGMMASRFAGSRPETTDDGPVPPCPDRPNCARVAARLAVPEDTVRQAVRATLADLSASDVVEEGNLTNAVVAVGPFRDDLVFAVEPDGDGSMLWVRSAARSGESDLGVNARRVAHLVESVRTRVDGAASTG